MTMITRSTREVAAFLALLLLVAILAAFVGVAMGTFIGIIELRDERRAARSRNQAHPSTWRERL